MNHRVTQLSIGLALIAGVSCIDMSAPTGAPASLSTLQVPAAFVVRGDSMRDSLGNAAPLSIIAYDQNGDTIGGVNAQFFITDTSHIARIAADNVVTAADTTGLVHVIGQVGGIQTPAVTVYVTERPAQIKSGVTPSDTINVTGAADTTLGRGKHDAPALIFAADGHTAIPGMLVHFSIAYAPDTTAPSTKVPHAVYLVDDQGKLSTVDTTDASGRASRSIIVIASRLSNPGKVDSVTVLATASYRNVPLAGSPLRLTIPVKVGF